MHLGPFASICVHSRFCLGLGCASFVSSGPPVGGSWRRQSWLPWCKIHFAKERCQTSGFVPPASSFVAGTTATSRLPERLAIRATQGVLLLLPSQVETRVTSSPCSQWTEVRAPQGPSPSICVHLRFRLGLGCASLVSSGPPVHGSCKEAVVVAVAQDSFGEGMPPKQGVRSSG